SRGVSAQTAGLAALEGGDERREVLLPHGGRRVGPVPSRPLARGNEDVPGAFHRCNEPFHEPQLGWVDEVIRRIDGQYRNGDATERGAGVVVARGRDL